MPDEWETYEQHGFRVRSVALRRRSLAWAAVLLQVGLVAGTAAALWFVACAILHPHHQPARSSSCQSNLKQIGISLIQYAQDYDGRWPTLTGRWPEVDWRPSLLPYLKSDRVFACPEREAELGYGLNALLYPPPTRQLRRVGPQTASLWPAADTLAIMDCNCPLAHPLLSPPAVRHPKRDPDRVSAGFLDGHVKMLNPAEIGGPKYRWTPQSTNP